MAIPISFGESFGAKWRRRLRAGRWLAGTLLLLGWSFAPGAPGAQPIVWRDGDGAWHVSGKEDWPDPPSRIKAGTFRPATTQIQFQVTYLDVANDTNVGFDDPALGAARRAVVDAVLEKLDDTLSYSSGVVEIQIRQSQTDGSGPLAVGGPFFSTAATFEDALALVHLEGGVDPAPAFPDMTMTVDFGYPYHAALTPPPVNQYDLYSVLLHEFTHGLGMVSLSTATGDSVSTTTVVFSRLDSLLYTGNGSKLWNGSGAFNGVAGWLTGSAGGVVFRGAVATQVYLAYPPIYTPASFAEGSSLSHWSTTVSGPPLMGPFIAAGQTIRGYQPFEIGALRDLGYQTVAPVTVNAVGDWRRFD